MKDPEIRVSGDVMSVSFDSDTDMGRVQQIMNAWQDSMVKEVERLAKELDVSFGVASDVYYLRTRSRHTPELERQIIDAYKAGHPIDSSLILSGDWPER